MYSKLPPGDEQFIYSKHVEDITGINLERKCISLVLITQKEYTYLSDLFCNEIYSTLLHYLWAYTLQMKLGKRADI